MDRIVVTVGPLEAASADAIAVSQTAPSGNALALTGTLTFGASDDNIAEAQSLAGADDVDLDGDTFSNGAARFAPASVQIISAGDDSGITFTVVGFTYAPGPFAGPITIVETVAGANASRVATRSIFHGITRVTASGATASTISIGTSGVAILDKPRRVLLSFDADESAQTFTVKGTNWDNIPISEDVPGTASEAVTLSDFATVTGVWVSDATAGAVTVGTNSVASSRPIFLDRFCNAPTALQVDVSGTANYTVQQSLNDPNGPAGYTGVNWINHPDGQLAGATASAQGNYAYIPNVCRIVLNSGSGSVTFTILQASSVVVN